MVAREQKSQEPGRRGICLRRKQRRQRNNKRCWEKDGSSKEDRTTRQSEYRSAVDVDLLLVAPNVTVSVPLVLCGRKGCCKLEFGVRKKKTEREESTYSVKSDPGTTVPVKMIWLLPHHPTLINWLWLQILESLKISSCFSQIWVEFPFAIWTMVLPIFKFTAPAVGELRKSKSDQRASRMENACIPPASCLHNCSNGRAMSKAIETASAQPVCL